MKRPLLLPLVPLYAAGAALRTLGLRMGLEPVRRLARPVISVGNLSAGGTGKTPFTIALARILTAQGCAVDILSRGYGRSAKDAAPVNPFGSFQDFGDEPLLIARETGLPVYVASQRWQAGRLAESTAPYPGIHLLDDGFQHRQLHRDLDIVLINSEDLADSLLPAGNLREPLSTLSRANILAIPENDEPATAKLAPFGKPIWRFRREITVPAIHGPAVAFCGIARPAQFFLGLEAAGVEVAEQRIFPDHHTFSAADVALLRHLVLKSGASALVTTAKDRVRLAALEPELAQIAPIVTAALRIVFSDPAAVAQLSPAVS